MGFTFDDTDTKGVASSIAEMHRLIAMDPKNADRIFPYIGGEEVNNSPVHEHHRYVINFEDFPLERKSSGHRWADLKEETQQQQLREGIVAPDYPYSVAADWPDLLRVVQERVKPERAHLGGNPDGERRKRLYWLWGRYTPSLNRATSTRTHVLVQCRISPWLAFALLKTGPVFDVTINVFSMADPMKAFPILQSRSHEVWARFMASSMKDDMRYTPSDCFENFPFPMDFDANMELETAGLSYYDFRAVLMIRNDEGLTKTYNRFHDPNEVSGDIMRLRELHAAMDRAVLDAYGWQDLRPVCEFFPEFDDEDEEDEGGRPKKKKYRYRWPDEIHDEVLARLLDLNRQRALEEGQLLAAEVAANALITAANKKSAKKSSRTKPAPPSFATLFGTEEEEA
jgi:hypothetical protein